MNWLKRAIQNWLGICQPVTVNNFVRFSEGKQRANVKQFNPNARCPVAPPPPRPINRNR